AQPPDDVHHAAVVEVQPWHCVAGPGIRWLLLDGGYCAVPAELHDPVIGWVGDGIGKDPASGEGVMHPELPAEAGSVEDVVAQDEGDGLVADVVGADQEGLRDAFRARLGRIAELEPELAAVT